MASTYFESTETETDFETGEQKKRKEVKKVKVESEPAYFKVYLEEIETILKLPKDSHKLLFEMAKEMKYDGIINVNAYLKDQWMKSLGDTNKQSVNNAISKLTTRKALN